MDAAQRNYGLTSVLRDEGGSYSTARVAFYGSLLFAGYMIRADALERWAVPDAAYALVTTVIVGLMLWAGGNRGLDHLAPAIAAIANVMGQVGMRVADRRGGKGVTVVSGDRRGDGGDQPPGASQSTVVTETTVTAAGAVRRAANQPDPYTDDESA